MVGRVHVPLYEGTLGHHAHFRALRQCDELGLLGRVVLLAEAARARGRRARPDLPGVEDPDVAALHQKGLGTLLQELGSGLALGFFLFFAAARRLISC